MGIRSCSSSTSGAVWQRNNDDYLSLRNYLLQLCRIYSAAIEMG